MNRFTSLPILSGIANKVKAKNVVTFIMRVCLLQEINEIHGWIWKTSTLSITYWITGLQFAS